MGTKEREVWEHTWLAFKYRKLISPISINMPTYVMSNLSVFEVNLYQCIG